MDTIDQKSPRNEEANLKDLLDRNTTFEHLVGWCAFLIILFWFYRIPPSMWADYLPAYGDPLEALWQIEFWRGAALNLKFDPVYICSAYPIGLHQLSVAHAGIGFLLIPISVSFGSAVALNLAFVSSLIFCFIGSYLFINNICRSHLISYFCSIVYVFAFGRTLHVHGHLHMLWASTFGAWMGAFLVRLCQKPSKRLAVIVGILWAAGIVSHLYMVFMGAILIFIIKITKNQLVNISIISITSILLSSPIIILFLLSSNYMQHMPPSIDRIIRQSSDLGSYTGWGR